MAVYKVIQDIEAEDKLVGFLTLKTFIYALIAATIAYINIRLLIASEVGPLRFIFILILLFPMLVFGILAAPLGRDQPTEVWILSHIKFYLNPHKRTWDQSGVQELVTITAPKKIERHLTKDFSQPEVQSRLKALATTLDSRGWAVKNVAVNLTANPSYLDIDSVDSDRLVSANSMAQDEVVDVHASDDIMDEQNNSTAQHFEALMQQADAKRKAQVLNKVNEARQEKEDMSEPTDSLFLDQVNNGGETNFVGRKIIPPGTENSDEETQTNESLDAGEEGFLDHLHQKAETVHAKSAGFKPKTSEHKTKKGEAIPEKVNAALTKEKGSAEVTDNIQNAKLKELIDVAKDDKLSTLVKEASRKKYQIKQTGPDEVEIDLHI